MCTYWTTYTGNKIDLENPSVDSINLLDIAYGLSNQVRWNGQTEYPYNIAEHSIHVEKIFCAIYPMFSESWGMAALLHDAAEYITGDVVAPVKKLLGGKYKNLEVRIINAIHAKFQVPKIPTNIKKAIKISDKLSAGLEAIGLTNYSYEEIIATIVPTGHELAFKNLVKNGYSVTGNYYPDVSVVKFCAVMTQYMSKLQIPDQP